MVEWQNIDRIACTKRPVAALRLVGVARILVKAVLRDRVSNARDCVHFILDESSN